MATAGLAPILAAKFNRKVLLVVAFWEGRYRVAKFRYWLGRGSRKL
jgi:hypothetical protein